MGAKVPQVSGHGHRTRTCVTLAPKPEDGSMGLLFPPWGSCGAEASDHYVPKETTLCPPLSSNSDRLTSNRSSTRGQTQWKTHVSNSAVPRKCGHYISLVAWNRPRLPQWSRQHINNVPFYFKNSSSWTISRVFLFVMHLETQM